MSAAPASRNGFGTLLMVQAPDVQYTQNGTKRAENWILLQVVPGRQWCPWPEIHLYTHLGMYTDTIHRNPQRPLSHFHFHSSGFNHLKWESRGKRAILHSSPFETLFNDCLLCACGVLIRIYNWHRKGVQNSSLNTALALQIQRESRNSWKLLGPDQKHVGSTCSVFGWWYDLSRAQILLDTYDKMWRLENNPDNWVCEGVHIEVWVKLTQHLYFNLYPPHANALKPCKTPVNCSGTEAWQAWFEGLCLSVHPAVTLFFCDFRTFEVTDSLSTSLNLYFQNTIRENEFERYYFFFYHWIIVIIS